MRGVALLVAWAAAAGCGAPGADGAGVGAVERAASEPRPGVEFDPAATEAGMRVGELTVESIAVETTPLDGIHVGSARFAGEIALGGETVRHPDYPEVRSVCFEADEESAARLPRWAGDQRRAWFCFENAEEAIRSLAVPGEIRPATVAVDRLSIHRGLSDEVNTARLVRVVERGESRPPD